MERKAGGKWQGFARPSLISDQCRHRIVSAANHIFCPRLRHSAKSILQSSVTPNILDTHKRAGTNSIHQGSIDTLAISKFWNMEFYERKPHSP